MRGRGNGARIVVRASNGSVKRLTTQHAAGERWPAVAPDGRRVAFVTVTERERQLRVQALDAQRDELIIGDRSVEHPAWSPSGDHIAFTSGGARGGVFVAPIDGRWVNFVSPLHAEPAWSPDGRTLALVDVPPAGPGYNGDPDRLGDRDANDA